MLLKHGGLYFRCCNTLPPRQIQAPAGGKVHVQRHTPVIQHQGQALIQMAFLLIGRQHPLHSLVRRDHVEHHQHICMRLLMLDVGAFKQYIKGMLPVEQEKASWNKGNTLLPHDMSVALLMSFPFF